MSPTPVTYTAPGEPASYSWEATNEEVARYDLSEEAGSETALNFAEVYRYNSEWKFRAVGQGYADGISGVAKDYQVSL